MGLVNATTLDQQYHIEAFFGDNGPTVDAPDATVGSEYTTRGAGTYYKKLAAGWTQLGSASGGSADWSNITNKPTTISGYGITDAFTESAADARYWTQAQADGRYLQLLGGTLSGDVTFDDDVTERFIRSSANGGAIRFRGNSVSSSDRGVWIGDVNNAGAWTPYIAVSNGAISFGAASAFASDVSVGGEITAAQATIGGYAVMRVRHSAMSGGIPAGMVEGEVWFGTNT